MECVIVCYFNWCFWYFSEIYEQFGFEIETNWVNKFYFLWEELLRRRLLFISSIKLMEFQLEFLMQRIALLGSYLFEL